MIRSIVLALACLTATAHAAPHKSHANHAAVKTAKAHVASARQELKRARAAEKDERKALSAQHKAERKAKAAKRRAEREAKEIERENEIADDSTTPDADVTTDPKEY